MKEKTFAFLMVTVSTILLVAIVVIVVAATLLMLSAVVWPKTINRGISGNSNYNSLKNWGLSNSEANSHIHAVNAWSLEEGSRDIIVAVIDTGIDSTHKDLKLNMWHDPTSKQPTYGWNFVTNQPNPIDDNGHGTHIAGIIGAVLDSEDGISGVAHHISIMAVKYYSDSNTGSQNLSHTIEAIDYAVQHGANIINYSGGGPEFSDQEYIALKKAESKDVMVITAAGNEHMDTDLVENYYYPAAYRLSNMVSVASLDIHNELISSSNWGQKKVDVGAPGENIYSTLPGNRFGYMTGTSQATAFVTGIAALLKSCNPKLTSSQIKSIIVNTVDRVLSLSGKVKSGGRVNAYAALKSAEDSGLCVRH